MMLKELRHNQQRSKFSPNVAVSTPFHSVLPAFGQPIGYGSGRGQPLSGTKGNRVATVALLETV